MALELNGTTGVSLVQDGVITDANLPAGSVLQVVQDTLTNAFALGNGTDVYYDTGLSVTITPSSASSTILVMGNINVSCASLGQGALMRVLRNGSNVTFRGDASGSRERVITGVEDFGDTNNDITYQLHQLTCSFIDSPSSTSAQTYKIQIKTENSAISDIVINRTGNDGDNNNYPRGASSLIVMEIAG